MSDQAVPMNDQMKIWMVTCTGGDEQQGEHGEAGQARDHL
jgi:hypothetical protein